MDQNPNDIFRKFFGGLGNPTTMGNTSNTNNTQKTSIESATLMREGLIQQYVDKFQPIIEKKKKEMKLNCKVNTEIEESLLVEVKTKYNRKGYFVKTTLLGGTKHEIEFDWSSKRVDKDNVIERLVYFKTIEDNVQLEKLLQESYRDGLKDIYFEFGKMLHENQYYDDAIILMKKHLELNPADNKAKFDLANILLGLEKTREALEYFFSVKDDEDVARLANNIFWNFLGENYEDKPFIRMDVKSMEELYRLK